MIAFHRSNLSINISVYLVDVEHFEDLSASRLIPFGWDCAMMRPSRN